MNKRIHELALQAGGSHYPTVGGKTLERFAELLILECVEICEQQSRVGWNEDRKNQAKVDAELIKQNFELY